MVHLPLIIGVETGGEHPEAESGCTFFFTTAIFLKMTGKVKLCESRGAAVGAGAAHSSCSLQHVGTSPSSNIRLPKPGQRVRLGPNAKLHTVSSLNYHLSSFEGKINTTPD